MDIKSLIRPHLRSLVPYSSARDEYTGKEGVFLDANENPFGSVSEGNWNRYPDPYQQELKRKLSGIKQVNPANIFIGNGSDEPIDLLIRAFCQPGEDEIMIFPPTYGMYKVAADINNITLNEVALTEEFQIDVERALASVNSHTKLMFVCSPNNPTGNLIESRTVERLLRSFDGLVVVDEAYNDFANKPSIVNRLAEFDNLVVLQTFSKAWGMAALRLGVAYAGSEIINVLNAIKPPYNVSGPVQQLAVEAIANESKKRQYVSEINELREELKGELSLFNSVKRIFPSDANFLLVRFDKARELFEELIRRKVILRDRSSVTLCDDCLRITVGTKEENMKLITELKQIVA